MRIGFDATILARGTRLTGGGEYASGLLKGLAALDNSDEFVLYAPSGTPRPRDVPASMEWRLLPSVPLGKLSSLFTHTVLIPRMARRDELDLLHVPTVHTRPSLPPVPGSLPCPLIVTIHDLIPITFYEATGNPFPWRTRTFYHWNLTRALRADHIITVSDWSRNEIIRHSGHSADRVTTIYNGVTPGCNAEGDADAMSGFGITSPFILFVGSWEPRKNTRRLLDAYDSALPEGLDEDLVLVVEKSSGHAQAIREHAQSLACWPRLRFLHSLSDAQMWALYRNASLFVYPSLSEGFGLPPVQAMACGTPVLSSPAGALREVLGDAAQYIDPLDTSSIAQGLLRLSADHDERRRLALAGPAQARRYTWKEAARQTAEVYHAFGRKAS